MVVAIGAGEFERQLVASVGDSDAAALQTLARMVERESLVLTFNDALLLMAVLFFAALLLMPLIRKLKAAPAAAH